jgi:hypothetical protein
VKTVRVVATRSVQTLPRSNRRLVFGACSWCAADDAEISRRTQISCQVSKVRPKLESENFPENYEKVRKFLEELFAYFPLKRQGSNRKARIEQKKKFFYCSSEFIVAVTFLPSSCLVTIKGYIYRHTNSCDTVGMGSGAMAYIIFKICSRIQTLFENGGGGISQTHRKHANLICLLLYF